MFAKTLVAFTGLLAAVSAIQVKSPAKDAELDFSKTNEITWSSVSTDPTTFSIVLVDQTNMDSTVIAASVNTADGKYTVTNFDATPGSKYRINLVANTPNNSGILAQSEEFEITNAGTEDAASTTSVSGTSSAATRSSSSTTARAATATDATATTSSSSTFSTAISTPTTTSNSTASQPSGAATSPNAATTLGKTFGVGGSLLAALFMLL